LSYHFTAVLDDWDPRVIDGLAAHRHVITFDNRGVGATRGKVPHTIAAMAADATAFIRVLGHEQSPSASPCTTTTLLLSPLPSR
jgi:pimeloyl-ACP methyl ester carboxylesterase